MDNEEMCRRLLADKVRRSIDGMASAMLGGTATTTADKPFTLDMLNAAIDKIKAMPPAPPPIRFTENINLTVPGPLKTVPRTWRERLFSLPWRPLQATRQVQTYVPDPNVYRLENGMVVGHPVTIAQLRSKLEG